MHGHVTISITHYSHMKMRRLQRQPSNGGGWTRWTNKDLTRTASQSATFSARIPFFSARTYYKNGYNHHKNSHTEQGRLSPIPEPTASFSQNQKVPEIANEDQLASKKTLCARNVSLLLTTYPYWSVLGSPRTARYH